MHMFTRSLGTLTLATGLASAAWSADLKVGFVTSLSGPGSSIGIPYAKGIQAAVAFKPAAHRIMPKSAQTAGS